MKKQFVALIEGQTENYLKGDDGRFVFSSLAELEEKVSKDNSITGVKVFEREVSDWVLKSEIMKGV